MITSRQEEKITLKETEKKLIEIAQSMLGKMEAKKAIAPLMDVLNNLGDDSEKNTQLLKKSMLVIFRTFMNRVFDDVLKQDYKTLVKVKTNEYRLRSDYFAYDIVERNEHATLIFVDTLKSILDQKINLLEKLDQLGKLFDAFGSNISERLHIDKDEFVEKIFPQKKFSNAVEGIEACISQYTNLSVSISNDEARESCEDAIDEVIASGKEVLTLASPSTLFSDKGKIQEVKPSENLSYKPV